MARGVLDRGFALDMVMAEGMKPFAVGVVGVVDEMMAVVGHGKGYAGCIHGCIERQGWGKAGALENSD